MQKRRLVLSIAAAVSGFAIQSHAAAFELCGLGVPPGSPGYAQFQAQKAAEIKRDGFLRVCDANLERYDIDSRLKPLDKVAPGLAFHPVDLAATPFAKFHMLGAVPEPVGKVVSRLYRSFRTPDGRTVTLFEHDMSADGAQLCGNSRDERFRGMAPKMSVLQTASGQAMSIVMWTEGRRYYEIWMDANAVLEHRGPQLLSLAASIPKPVPARLQEPDREECWMGPDGKPNFPPAPMILTDEQMKALMKKSRQ